MKTTARLLALVCAAAPARAGVGFNEHIRPIFTKHCTACHGGFKQAAGLSFVYRPDELPPILERVRSADPDFRMPPPEHGPALSRRETELLGEWVKQGAKWEKHWAYAKPARPPVPTVERADWPRRPLDHFVLADLERRDIAPSPDAAPERWLRRVTLDMTGLPPTPADRAAFLNDPSPARRERVVDRLLASPAFGERWASVWLDQVRYADSKGLGLDGRRNVWKYRDWVIDAFNRDLPYDEFTVKQIAGDLLPGASIEDRIASAAQRLSQTNEEGGTDDEEFRVAAVLDRVNTTWQAWQGVTFGCAQCHSHPYDPFRHEEYYKFTAFFNNTADCDLSEDWPFVMAPVDTRDYERAAKLDREIGVLREKVWRREFRLLKDESRWRPLTGLGASSNKPTKLAVGRRWGREEFRTVDTVARDTDIAVEAALPAGLGRLTAVRLTALPLDPARAVSDSEWGFVLSHVEASLLAPGKKPRPLRLARVLADEPAGVYDPQLSLNAKSRRGFAAYTRIHHPRRAAFVLKTPAAVPAGSRLRVTLKHRVFILASFSLVTRRGRLDVTGDAAFTKLLSDKTLSKTRSALADRERRRRRIRSTPVPTLVERPEHLSRPSHLFIRGLFLTKGERVSPGVPESLPPLPGGPADRLALAKWVAGVDNPLTARVAVNRVWARLFGTGLVATEEDFGSSGDPPSHPALLDYLACRFQGEQGWSRKRLVRGLALSRTYRQSAKARPELCERDPKNRLLARGPRGRLPAEVVRDQALAVSGLLSRGMHGRPVNPPIPGGVWKPFAASDKWKTPPAGDGDRYRRSVYTYTKRSIPYPMFAAFDAPSREFCSPRRLTSNTPLQALMTLNGRTFAECAASLAGRMRDAADTPRGRVRRGFLLATCREPNETELAALIKLHQASDLDAVARVLLNLDEVLTK